MDTESQVSSACLPESLHAFTLPECGLNPNVSRRKDSVGAKHKAYSEGRHEMKPNPILQENALPGDDSWPLQNRAANREIEGFASATSVNRGQSIQFFVRTAASRFSIDIYRMGWYQGLGARRVRSVPDLPGIDQPMPAAGDRGLIACEWVPSFTLVVPEAWCTGIYLAKLTTTSPADPPFESYLVFVVRDDSRAGSLLFQASVNTYQAYNSWGGKSLYGDISFDDPDMGYQNRSQAVSFDRPYADGAGSGQFLFWEYPMLRWLERNGYDVNYVTNIDTDTDPGLLTRYNVFLSVGHDEYWSADMREHVESALDKGVSLGFFGANAVFWQVRFEAGRRVMVSYKDEGAANTDPLVGIDNAHVTRQWRDPFLGRPEQSLIGQMFETWFSGPNFPLRFINTDTWPFRDTGLQDGDTLPGIVGYECDRVKAGVSTPPDLLRIAESPVKDNANSPHTSHTTLYTAPSGATVFAAGTISWSWGLDDLEMPFLAEAGGSHTVASPALQQLTANVLGRLMSLRALITSFAGGGEVASLYAERYGESPWLDGWCDADDLQLTGDFMGRGHDQVLFLNRGGVGGRVMIADFRGGVGHVEIVYWEDWGEKTWLDGWDSAANLQLVGDFMARGHDQVLFIHRGGGDGRVMIADFGGAGGVEIVYQENRGENPWLDGWDSDTQIRRVGDFMGQGRDQALFIDRRSAEAE